MRRMNWSYHEYMETPVAVLGDVLLVMEAEAVLAEAERAAQR